MAYRVSPFQREERPADAPAPVAAEDSLTQRLTVLETKLNKLLDGGKFDGLL